MKIKVVAIDDHALMVKMVEEKLKIEPDMELVGTANHGNQMLQLVRKTNADVVVLDLSMGKRYFAPIDAVQALKQEFPRVQILVLTSDETKATMISLVRLGVLGYILKSDDELSVGFPEGIRRIYRGKPFYSSSVIEALVTPMEETLKLFSENDLKYIRLIARGFSNKGIAQELGVSVGRVGNIVSELYAKAGLEEDDEINSRIALVNFARELGLLSESA